MSEMPRGFKAKVFTGELRGNELSARCRVWRDEDGAEYLDEVTPPLPDGDYELLVNGLKLQAQCRNGVWTKIEYMHSAVIGFKTDRR